MKASTKKTISIVIPILNEEKNIPVLYKEVIKNVEGFNREFIFINDGSTDRSAEIINKLREKDKSVKLVNLSRNFGHQIAITCGVDMAGGDAAIIMDADLQDPPTVIPKMIKKWQEGYDVVYGKRLKREGESYFKLWTARAFYSLINLLSGTKIPDNVGDFRLISKNVIEVLKVTREYQRFLRGMISWVGFDQTAVQFKRARRYSGKSKYSTLSMVKLGVDALLSFSFFPLRIASFLGIATATGAIGFIFYTLILTAGGTTVKGWPSTIVLMLFLGSIQLITIGIIGEYLGRIYEEVKKRPLYIIRSTVGIKRNAKI
ncbi:MAG: glycosyltransferase family 2 protein [Candidatus Curtissbacteria bacterium]|nr:glycosyltransferase family 2 protein [Candidatus Curtissbacteria bacterium]